jgi:competence protein ComEC
MGPNPTLCRWQDTTPAGASRRWHWAGWRTGVALPLQQAALLVDGAYLLAFAFGAVALAAGTRWRRSLVACAGALALGFGLTGVQASQRLAERLAPALEGQDLLLTGVVASLPQQGPTGLRFRLAVESARPHDSPVAVPAPLALGWYRGAHEGAVGFDLRGELRAGQRWRPTARLRQPHGSLRPTQDLVNRYATTFLCGRPCSFGIVELLEIVK